MESEESINHQTEITIERGAELFLLEEFIEKFVFNDYINFIKTVSKNIVLYEKIKKKTDFWKQCICRKSFRINFDNNSFYPKHIIDQYNLPSKYSNFYIYSMLWNSYSVYQLYLTDIKDTTLSMTIKDCSIPIIKTDIIEDNTIKIDDTTSLNNSSTTTKDCSIPIVKTDIIEDNTIKIDDTTSLNNSSTMMKDCLIPIVKTNIIEDDTNSSNDSSNKNIFDAYIPSIKIYKQFISECENIAVILDIFGNLFYKTIQLNSFNMKLVATNIKDVFANNSLSFNINHFIIFFTDIHNKSYIYSESLDSLHNHHILFYPEIDSDVYLSSNVYPLKYQIKHIYFDNDIIIITNDNHSFQIHCDRIARGIGMLETFLRDTDIEDFINKTTPDVIRNSNYISNKISLTNNFSYNTLYLKIDNKLEMIFVHTLTKENVISYEMQLKHYNLPLPNLEEGEFISQLRFNKKHLFIFNQSDNIFLKYLICINISKHIKKEEKEEDILVNYNPYLMHNDKIYLLNCNFISSYMSIKAELKEEIYNFIQEQLSSLQYILLEDVIKIDFKIIKKDNYIFILDNKGNLYIHHKFIFRTSYEIPDSDEINFDEYLDDILNYKAKFTLFSSNVANYEIHHDKIIIESYNNF